MGVRIPDGMPRRSRMSYAQSFVFMSTICEVVAIEYSVCFLPVSIYANKSGMNSILSALSRMCGRYFLSAQSWKSVLSSMNWMPVRE